ncbi:hypothetical protein JOM56_004168 [Amanita muscaria]
MSTESDLARLLMDILHTEGFFPPPPKSQVNLKVVLDYPENGITGAVTVQSDVARKFLRWVKENPIEVDGNKLRFYIIGRARGRLTKFVLKTSFINPDEEKGQQIKLPERLRFAFSSEKITRPVIRKDFLLDLSRSNGNMTLSRVVLHGRRR